MPRPGWAVLLASLISLPAFADSAEDLDRWFREGYAALYENEAWNRADEFAQYFADEIAYRSDEGLDISDVNDFVVADLEGWREEGWIGTDVAALDTRLLNSTTALFDIHWKDRNADGSTTYECGWYFADKVDGKWLLSQYIVMECAD